MNEAQPMPAPDPAWVCATADRSVAGLVAQAYSAAPPAERARILEQLLRPLGVLSLVAVADGVFAKVRFRAGWQDMHVRPEDTQPIGSAQIAALVEYVQQVCVEAVDGLAPAAAAAAWAKERAAAGPSLGVR